MKVKLFSSTYHRNVKGEIKRKDKEEKKRKTKGDNHLIPYLRQNLKITLETRNEKKNS